MPVVTQADGEVGRFVQILEQDETAPAEPPREARRDGDDAAAQMGDGAARRGMHRHRAAHRPIELHEEGLRRPLTHEHGLLAAPLEHGHVVVVIVVVVTFVVREHPRGSGELVAVGAAAAARRAAAAAQRARTASREGEDANRNRRRPYDGEVELGEAVEQSDDSVQLRGCR